MSSQRLYIIQKRQILPETELEYGRDDPAFGDIMRSWTEGRQESVTGFRKKVQLERDDYSLSVVMTFKKYKNRDKIPENIPTWAD